jgi:hypothetical protein
MTHQYVAFVWDHSGDETVLVEKKELKNMFKARNYQEVMEAKGYEVTTLNTVMLDVITMELSYTE